jgi:hypothetical protein
MAGWQAWCVPELHGYVLLKGCKSVIMTHARPLEYSRGISSSSRLELFVVVLQLQPSVGQGHHHDT